jgi:BioD-like phosphotransacetylase family protein
MSALITSVEHALAVAAQDVVKTAKFAETSVLPALKSAQANQSTIESITSLVDPQAANIERAGFAVLGVIINAIDGAGAAAGTSGLNITLDAQLVADVKAIAAAVKGALSPAVAAAPAK